ncbi:MAG TPA: acyl-CoA dehydrogenase family protein, partial [Burkholderiales bacterium]|nr:acyl-CoA dehydrogenase family protein [Burkholderiales bacterium]
AAQSRGYRLTGNAARVPWASQADELIVFARDGAGQAFIARVAPPEGQRRRNLAFEPRDDLRFDVSIAADAVRAAPPRLHDDGFLALGALMRAQQLVGAMERCMDYAVSYAMERQQFGRPIAKFQAIQHMLAEAAGHYAAATAAADLALDAWDGEDFAFNVGIAKARVGEAAGKVAEITHQVHGAMGFTQEHPLHFSTRRLWSWREEFGSESYWQDRIGRAVCATGGDGLWPRLVGG